MKTLSQYKADVYALWGDEYRVIGAYTGNKNKIKMWHAKCNCEFEVTPNNFLSKHSSCPICCNRLIIKGINDINTTAPTMAKYTFYEEDRYKYSCCSNIKIDWICPRCGKTIKDKTPYEIYYNGFSCIYCSDGISYPNKFFHELFRQLEQKNLIQNYISEYSPKWISPKRYDNYFEINNNKYIVEVDGGIGHGKHVFKNSKLTIEDSLLLDEYKDSKAIENDIAIIRIDANESTLKYLKDSIINSLLSNIVDLSCIDWELCHISALSSKKIEAINLYNNGYKSTGQIAELLSLNINTITTYLKDASKNMLCDYSTENANKNRRYRSYNNEKQVICLETSKVYHSLADAARDCKIKSVANIQACCVGQYHSAGKDNMGNKLHWMYYEEYLSLSSYDKNNYLNLERFIPNKPINHRTGKNVINLETKEIFLNANKAGQHYGANDGSCIRKCIKNNNLTAYGFHWMNYDEYCLHGSFLF